MAQDPGKIFQHGKPAQCIQVFFGAATVQHSVFCAEISDIIHLPVVRDWRRVGTYFVGIQKPVFQPFPQSLAFPGKSAA